MVKNLILTTFMFCFIVGTRAQDTIPPAKHFFFGNIFTDFYRDFSNHTTPSTGFELTTGLLGYHTDLTPKIKAQLIYDVTRTTSGIEVLDSTGTALTVNYFEGSKYTAFLKQAEIDWQFASGFELSAGQLLNQQYLTVQDKFWGYRFVAVSFQEMYRFGNPADFGMRLSYRLKNKLLWSIGGVNGEGPFRHQDNTGDLQIFNNIEYRPDKHIILKLYSDIKPADGKYRSANALFLAYKTDHYRIGFEYNRVDFDETQSAGNMEGASAYTSIKLSQKIDVFARYDGLFRYTLFDHEHKYYTGVCYTENKLQTALSFRYFSFDESLMLYWSFGIKF